MQNKLPGQPGYHAVFNPRHRRGDGTKTGLERFYEKYPNWPDKYRASEDLILGVGAPMIDVTSLVEKNG